MVSDLIIDVLLPGGGNSRKATKIYRRGDPATATIVGIDYEHLYRSGADGDSNTRHTSGPEVRLALQVNAPKPFVSGVLQRVDPLDHLRLGQQVNVRYRKERAVVAADAGGGFEGSEPHEFCKAPASGITDKSLWDNVIGWSKDLPATITFTEARAVPAIASTKIAASAVVQGPGFADFTAQLDNVRLRPYSSHLEALNYPLPGWARPGKRNEFIVDWATAAMRVPGIGAPPGYFRELIGAAVSMDPLHGQVDPATSWSGQGLIDAANMAEPKDEVSFELWATALVQCKVTKVRYSGQSDFVQQFGIPAGTWEGLSAHWSDQMRTNPRLMIAMREIEKRVKKQHKRR